MSDYAIRVEDLGKQYHIGALQKQYSRLGDKLTDVFGAPFRRAGKMLRGRTRSAAELDETIWALRDVNFEVKYGEAIGIIGRNGAGKSTLLKILSRITEPTEGRVRIRGRVGSLLEVGTGFHPELTGRENIFLNGAILGMTRGDIERKFEEIVDFAGIPKFIDTPVKHYSSGMYVRLAFSVAAHLEPEILLVDEVLAVGDAAFQKKCLDKMGEVSDTGRTVLFVSHNMAAIQSLCSYAHLIEEGGLTYSGSPGEAVRRYLTAEAGRQTVTFGPNTSRKGSGRARYISATILDSGERPTSSVGIGEGFTVELRFLANEVLNDPGFGVIIRDQMGSRIAWLVTRITHGTMPPAGKGGVVHLHVERFDVLPGLYYLTFGMSIKRESLDLIENALELQVMPKDVYPGGKLPKPGQAIMYVPCHWSHDYS